MKGWRIIYYLRAGGLALSLSETAEILAENLEAQF
jgi:hypothetical protein